MHPIYILIPASVLMFGPRIWVNHVLKQHNLSDGDSSKSAGELARELLDRNGLQLVKVEITDRGDHYDPKEKSVRIGRDKFDRTTLTAVTTAAHEVAHAIQDATGYAPFHLRSHLVKLAQVTRELGGALLFVVPVTAFLSKNPAPTVIVGASVFSMLITGVIAQLAALPSELDASFNRALPMLRGGYIEASQTKDARRILLACSLTYIASSLVAVLNIWPWIGRGLPLPTTRPAAPAPAAPPPAPPTPAPGAPAPAGTGLVSLWCATASSGVASLVAPVAPRMLGGLRSIGPLAPSASRPAEDLLRRLVKPVIRGWLTLGRVCSGDRNGLHRTGEYLSSA